jgi:hypothetical protein
MDALAVVEATTAPVLSAVVILAASFYQTQP